jgi:hypothetical protein
MTMFKFLKGCHPRIRVMGQLPGEEIQIVLGNGSQLFDIIYFLSYVWFDMGTCPEDRGSGAFAEKVKNGGTGILPD